MVPTYTPAATVERTGFSIETLRYYERIGLLRDVPRDGSGHRCFTDEHLSWLEILRCLRDTGMPIAQMQRYVELPPRMARWTPASTCSRSTTRR